MNSPLRRGSDDVESNDESPFWSRFTLLPKRRRRAALWEEVRSRLQRASKATQTDVWPPPTPWPTLNFVAEEPDDDDETGEATSFNESASSSAGAALSRVSGASSLGSAGKRVRLVVNSNASTPSSLPSSSTTTTSSSSYTRRYRPSARRIDHRIAYAAANTPAMSDARYSFQSTPATLTYAQQRVPLVARRQSADVEFARPQRRWTFSAIGLTQPGAPRGLCGNE